MDVIQKVKSPEAHTAETGIRTPVRFTKQTLRTRAVWEGVGSQLRSERLPRFPYSFSIGSDTKCVLTKVPPSVTTSEVVHLLKPPPEWGGWIRGG